MWRGNRILSRGLQSLCYIQTNYITQRTFGYPNHSSTKGRRAAQCTSNGSLWTTINIYKCSTDTDLVRHVLENKGWRKQCEQAIAVKQYE